MSDEPAPNTPEARDPTGQIKDQTPPTTSTEMKPPTTETKPSEPTITEPKADDKKSLVNEKGEGAPKEYEEFKVPDGFELDAEVTKEVGTLFKGMNLTQDNAQKLVDFYVAKTQEANEAPFKLWQDTQDKWINEVKADKEIGGKLDEVKSTISKAIDSLGDPTLSTAFRQVLDYTGAGNNLHFIKGLYKLASQLTEGGHVAGKGPSEGGQQKPGAGPRSVAQALYPNLPSSSA